MFVFGEHSIDKVERGREIHTSHIYSIPYTYVFNKFASETGVLPFS